MKYGMFIVFALFVSTSLHASVSEEKFQSFDLEDIRKIMNSPSIGSVDAFVNALPSFMKGPQYSTLAYEAHGLLPSSPEHPLVFLFGDSRSTVVLTFQGKPNPKGEAETMEILSFDRELKKHSLHEIYFLRGEKPRMESSPEVMQKKCGSCHGMEIKPLWRAGYEWPGFFGSKGDEFPRFSEAGKEEKASFEALKNSKNPRVNLIPLAGRFEQIKGTLRSPNPNIGLAGRLASEHASALVEKILSSPRYQELRNQIVSGLALCQNVRPLLDVLAEIGISREFWFLNTELQPEPGKFAALRSEFSSFEMGNGPIEFILLTKLFERDSELRKMRSLLEPFEQRSVNFIRKHVSLEYPGQPYGPIGNSHSGFVDPDEAWCSDFSSKLNAPPTTSKSSQATAQP